MLASSSSARYNVLTKHTLEQRSFQVEEEIDSGGRVVWKTERILVADELVELVKEVTGTTTCSIHQPIRGWYLHIKSTDQSFSIAQPYVNLIPSHTNPSKDFRFILKHSPSNARPRQDSGESSHSTSAEFLVLPHSGSRSEGRNKRLSLRNLTEVFASTRNSFTLFWENGGQQLQILHFEDHPSLIHTDTKGALTLDEGLIAILNVDKTFFIAVAIAYLGFLEDQEAYKAAVH